MLAWRASKADIPLDELETYAERDARLTEEAGKSRASPGKSKPANKPLL